MDEFKVGVPLIAFCVLKLMETSTTAKTDEILFTVVIHICNKNISSLVQTRMRINTNNYSISPASKAFYCRHCLPRAQSNLPRCHPPDKAITPAHRPLPAWRTSLQRRPHRQANTAKPAQDTNLTTGPQLRCIQAGPAGVRALD